MRRGGGVVVWLCGGGVGWLWLGCGATQLIDQPGRKYGGPYLTDVPPGNKDMYGCMARTNKVSPRTPSLLTCRAPQKTKNTKKINSSQRARAQIPSKKYSLVKSTEKKKKTSVAMTSPQPNNNPVFRKVTQSNTHSREMTQKACRVGREPSVPRIASLSGCHMMPYGPVGENGTPGMAEESETLLQVLVHTVSEP